jgi:hypothetical protein
MDPLDAVVRKLRSIEGIIDVWHVANSDKKTILELERKSNENAGLAIGIEILNKGAMYALEREFVVCVNHSPALRHPQDPILILAADEEIVGEEVWKADKITELRADPNALFLGRNFVLFKDKVNALKKRQLRFEYGPQGFHEIETIEGVCDVVSATISLAADIYVKKKAKWLTTDSDRGTVLIGFNSPASHGGPSQVSR